MTGPDPDYLRREASAARVGRTAHLAFVRKCQTHKVDYNEALASPLTMVTLAELEADHKQPATIG